MRKILLVFLLGALSFVSPAEVRLQNGVEVSPRNAHGLDKVYDFDTPALTPAPEGYKAFCVEHYGRHGSRYAYSSKYYDLPKAALERGESKGVLTDLGKKIWADFRTHYEKYSLRMGDLTDLGWQQQKRIGQEMARNFPDAFREGADVFASSSGSRRSMISMSGCCLGLQAEYPEMPIREEDGIVFLNATHPRDSRNPEPPKNGLHPFPFTESLAQFQERKLPSERILSKLFTDIDKACLLIPRNELVRRLYMLSSGMDSLNPEDRTDFSGLFTEEEFALMWEVDNYQRYIEYYPYFYRCYPVPMDIISDAGRRLSDLRPGATLRFGHDHVLMSILGVMGIAGYDVSPISPEDVSNRFRTWDSPMATNLQFIIYLPESGSGEPLFKLLFNGVEQKLDLEGSFPYYKWSDFCKKTTDRINLL